MKERGFTLIELVVVITIISILAAFILGAIQDVRQGGYAVQCTNNLREVAAANLRYAGEHDGRFCPAQEPNNNVRWHGVRTGNSAPFDPTKGALAPYLGTEARVKLCPVFRDIVKGANSFENGSGGYGYNAVYVGGTPSNKWFGEMMVNFPNPSRTVMFADCALSRDNGVQEYPFAEPWQWVSPIGKLAGSLSPSVHFRHRGKANVAWCDGHVTSESPAKLGSANYYGGDDTKEKIGWFGPEEENGYWNPRYEPAP